MIRVFAGLAVANFLLLLASGGMGLWRGLVDRHVLLAVLTLVLSCFVQVVVFTYFTVTGKLIAQAVNLGKLEVDAIQQARRLKRRVTFWVGGVALASAALSASGALHWRHASLGSLHLVTALTVIAVHVLAFYREIQLIVENKTLIESTMGDFALAQKSTIEASAPFAAPHLDRPNDQSH